MKDITLRLKEFGSYSKTIKGVFVYTEHRFKIFIPNKILNKMVKK